MLNLKKKLDSNLMYYISNNIYKDYRVLIKYKRFQKNIEKRIRSFKGVIINHISMLNIITAKISAKSIRRLMEYPEIEKILLDEFLFIGDLSANSSSRHTFNINSKFTGKNIGIAIIDSGVYPHKCLTTSKHKISLFSDLINNINYPYDDNGHGTCICGILNGNMTTTEHQFKSICPNSKLFCYKAFDKLGKGYASDILFSINQIIEISKENNIKVICLPFELLANNIYILNLFKSIFDISIKNGLIPVTSCGSINTIYNSIMGIAILDNCITVGGLDAFYSNSKMYDYSSVNNLSKKLKPDVLAPCDSIVSLNCDCSYISEKNGVKLYPHNLNVPYKTFSGVSLSAAYISGISALLCEKNPEADFYDILSLIKAACENSENIPKNLQGNGIININELYI